jgi:xylose isomerase
MTEPFFPNTERVSFAGPDTDNPLAYRYYQPDRQVLGKSMGAWLRPAVCYWHTLCWDGSDTFGSATMGRAWHAAGGDEMIHARRKLDVGFELFEKLGVPFFTFHDRDLAPEAGDLRESDARLSQMTELAAAAMQRTGVGLLWGTANLFSHPRYAAGAATNPDPEVFACAAFQVRRALEVTQQLGGENYVMWGGREGYDTLLNTDMTRELDQLGRFMAMIVEHKHRIGFKGTLLIEPKPMEPTKHQYDFDTASVYAFLQRYDLEQEIKLNIEVNHATLAGHGVQHELQYAASCGLLGSVDANRGDPQLGWDTDQFPCSVEELTLALYTIVQAGGLGSGGFNFDAKLRRQSIDPFDLLVAHVGGLDTLALALLNAERLVQSDVLAGAIEERYAGWKSELGSDILGGKSDLASLAEHALQNDLRPQPRSGRQELLEHQVARIATLR